MANYDSIYDVSSIRGSNLDLWVNPGMFFFTAEAMKACHNAPTAEAGSLMVISANNKTHVYQLYLVYASNTIYFRSKAGTTWTTWYTNGSSQSVESVVVVSTDENNVLTAGSDGGAYLSSEAIPDVTNLVASAKYDIATGVLSFYNTSNVDEGTEAVATVTIPASSTVLESASVEEGKLKLVWKLVDDSTTETDIDLSSLIDEYTAGTGILVENKIIKINTEWLSTQIPDVSGFATKTELTTLEESLPDKYCLAYITSDTGTSRIQNEVTGSGPMYTHTDGTRSYVGVNNGGADSIVAQIYAINDSTKFGTRINIFNKGAYYIPNMSSSDAGYEIDGEQYEIAVKGDLPTVETLALPTDPLETYLASRGSL